MLYQELMDYLNRAQALHVMVVIFSVLTIAVLVCALVALRRARLENEVMRKDSVNFAKLNASYYSELCEWRRIFGPFYAVFKNSPEGDPSMKHNDKTIAVDLDGVILEYVDPWNGTYHFGAPIEGAAEALRKLRDLGYTIAIYTTRNNPMTHVHAGHDATELASLVREELLKHKIPFDFISLFKPLARYYVDDRAVYFSNWPATLRSIGYHERVRLSEMASRFDELESPDIERSKN